MKKGSITVFLSLILVLLLSFLLTTLEAARIRGATAYASMLSELAGDSFLASYYYPLFEHYRLFGVDMGDSEGFFSEGTMAEEIKEDIIYGTESLSGGLLQFQGTGVTELQYETMLSRGEEAFLSQIRQQVVLDGLSLMLAELFSEEQFLEAGVVGEVYREQEEALAATATVTKELIKLMELVDGIRMEDNGIVFDKNGKMQVEEVFIKQLVSMEQEEIRAAYDNAEVFQTLSGKFFRADQTAESIETLLAEADQLADDISRSENKIWEYQNRKEEVKKEWKAEKKRLEEEETPDNTKLLQLEQEMDTLESFLVEEEGRLDSYESGREGALSQAKTQYKELKQKLEAVEALLNDGLEIVEELKKEQRLAGIAVDAYETFLEGVKSSLSEELYQVFWKELEKMKIYAGLDEQGFSIELMEQSLQGNLELLEDLSLSGFSERTLDSVKSEVEAVKSRMGEYCVDGLWFSYGEVVVAEQTWNNIMGFLGELLTTGVLSLVGVPEEEQSDRSLSGEDLPSAGLEKETLLEELITCIEEVQALFQDGSIGEILKTAGNAALDKTALELYSMKYFHCFGEESPYTKLNYEREYLIFGNEKDKSNLLSMVLYLVAIRALFCMVMILKQPDRMAQLETLSMGVVGFTGMPALAAAVKYGALLLWSVEEALVEVSALLQGKRVALLGMGTVSFGELLFMNKAAIERKSRTIPDGVGVEYSEYLALVSLTKGTKERAYRAMDLIQENIRYRYRDSFRIRNLVTKISFCTKTEVREWFNAGLFPASAYELECREVRAY